MVIRLAAGLLALTAAAPASAGSADWSRAGGGIFVQAGAPAVASGASGATSAGSQAEPSERVHAAEQPYAEAVAQAAQRHGLDPKLLHALVVVESAYRPTALSRAGAAGLTQLMPGTASELGVRDRMDPAASLQGGASYLARQLVRFGDLRLALAAYNAGPDRVARLGRVPSIQETRSYVAAVVDCYLALTAGRGVRSSRDCASAGTTR